MIVRAGVLALSLVLLAGCATGKDSWREQWREGGPVARSLLVVHAVCMAGLAYLVYHVSSSDGDGGAITTGSCRDCDTTPATPGFCYAGRDVATGAPCW